MERARLAQVAEILNRGRLVGQERRHVRVGIGDAAELIGAHPDQADVTAHLDEVIPDRAVDAVVEGQRVRVVRRAAAVARAVDANQTAGRDQRRGRPLSRDAGVGDVAGEADRDVLEAGLRVGALGARRAVVAELELVDHPVAEDALQVDDRVGRVQRRLEEAAAGVLRIVALGLIVEDPAIHRPVAVDLPVETQAVRVFADVLVRLPLIDVEVRVGRRARQNMRVRRDEPRAKGGDRRNGAGPGGRARCTLDQVAASVQTVAFVAAEEERAILRQRPAHRTTELVEAERRLRHRRRAAGFGDDAAVGVALRVEVVRGIELVAAQVLEHRAVHRVGARLGDHADLPAGSRAVLGSVAAGLDAELLHVLQARLQLEEAGVLAVQHAGRRVDDPAGLDAVVLDDVLIDGAS